MDFRRTICKKCNIEYSYQISGCGCREQLCNEHYCEKCLPTGEPIVDPPHDGPYITIPMLRKPTVGILNYSVDPTQKLPTLPNIYNHHEIPLNIDNDRYTFIRYTHSWTDTCRNCEMGRYDSDFDIEFGLTVQGVVDMFKKHKKADSMIVRTSRIIIMYDSFLIYDDGCVYEESVPDNIKEEYNLLLSLI